MDTTNRACHLLEELAQPPAQPFVLERRAGEFLVYPGRGIPAGTIHRAPGRYVSVLDNASRPSSFGASPELHPADVGNWKPHRTDTARRATWSALPVRARLAA